uniref:Na+/H+ antiporter n=1 Tax=Quercus lobata TaxID=97700 RepID=A0A7N2L8G1_QUELO
MSTFYLLQFSYQSLFCADSVDLNPTDAVLFVGISLVLGIACRHLLRGTRVPYTVALLILGIALGSIAIKQVEGDDLTQRRTARSCRHELGAVISKARPWRDRDDDEIEGDDLTQRRMARLGLGRWAELEGASSISLSSISLRALSFSLLSLWCLSPEMV